MYLVDGGINVYLKVIQNVYNPLRRLIKHGRLRADK